MNELINLMYQIKDLSTRTNEISLIDLQPRLMAVYDKLEAEKLSICDVGCQREQLITFLMKVGDCYGMELRENAERCVDEILSN